MRDQTEPMGVLDVHMPDVVIAVRKIVWEGDGKRRRLPRSVFYPADMLFRPDDLPADCEEGDLAAVVLEQMAEEYGWGVVDCSIEFPSALLDAFLHPRAAGLAA